MTVEMSAPAVGLTAYAAAEIRAYLGRLNITKAELARRINENETWIGKRLNGRIDMTLTDLERIAAALAVPYARLLPREGGPTPWKPPVDPLAPRIVAIGGKTDMRHRRPDHPIGSGRAVRLSRDTAEGARRPVSVVAR